MLLVALGATHFCIMCSSRRWERDTHISTMIFASCRQGCMTSYTPSCFPRQCFQGQKVTVSHTPVILAEQETRVRNMYQGYEAITEWLGGGFYSATDWKEMAHAQNLEIENAMWQHVTTQYQQYQSVDTQSDAGLTFLLATLCSSPMRSVLVPRLARRIGHKRY